MSSELTRVLVVDDEPRAIEVCRDMLEATGIEGVAGCTDSRQAMDAIARLDPAVVILDLTMPHLSGRDLLPRIAADRPGLPVVVFTGADEVDTAVECMRAGAFDYLVKPADETRLETTVRRALEMSELRREYDNFKRRVLSGSLERPEAFADIVTNNPQMVSLFQYVEAVAPTDRPVLILGETGVGKELLARAVHRLSARRGEFVAVNAAGLDDNMFSDTLFGHARGAFTGADRARPGLVERAARGTLFLDEIGDLSAASQVKLLRLLQEREYLPLGSDVARQAEARVIVATHEDLRERTRQGIFREDLLYRLQTHEVRMPPLRERPDDLPLLVEHFLERAARDMNKRKPTAPPELYHLLGAYHFPGNVRELEAMVFDAVAHHEARVLSTQQFREHIERGREEGPPRVVEASSPKACAASPFAFFDRLPTLKEAPRLLIDEALRRSQGNQAAAARLLGITPSGLSKALRRAGDQAAQEGD